MATTSAATAAATTTTAATVSAAPAATTTAASSLCLRPCFVHHQVASAKILPIQRIHRTIRILIAIHFDERETARLPRKAVTN
jgi:hypothetical protein